nr:hypothetical protein [Tanacetum cinerariifolium]
MTTEKLTANSQQLTAKVWELLDEVLDPEVPVLSILDLGIVRGVQVAGEHVTVHITPT